MILIGYSGHAYVAYAIFQSMGVKVHGYCDVAEKTYNPFNLVYLGNEESDAAIGAFRENDLFISVGENRARRRIFEQMAGKNKYPVNAVHASSMIAPGVELSSYGVMVSAGAVMNPLCKAGICAIINSGAIIEHECIIGDFSHIGPGAVLCGNVVVGENSFVGASAVIRQGITIGKNVIIGAGSVVVKDIPDGATVMGSPAR